MRILHTADLHLGKLLEGRGRTAEQKAMLDEITAIAAREEIDLVLIAGDVFDTYNPSAEAERLFFAFLEKISADGQRAVVAIAGNHDQPQRFSAVSPLAEQNGIYLLGMPFDLPEVQDFDENKVCLLKTGFHSLRIYLPKAKEEAVIAALPYLSESRLNELLSQDLSDEKAVSRDYQERLASIISRAEEDFSDETVNLIMAHLFLRGGRESDSERKLPALKSEAADTEDISEEEASTISVGGSYGVSSEIFGSITQYAALGHLHRPQQISSPIPCVYAGSPLAYSFSECNQTKSVIIIEAKPQGEVQWQRIPLQSGYPLMRMNFDSYDEVLTWCSQEINQNFWLKIKMTVPLSAEQVNQLKLAHPRILAVEIKPQPTEQAPHAKLEQLSEAEKFHVFAREALGREPEEELINLAIQLMEDQDDSTNSSEDGEVDTDEAS